MVETAAHLAEHVIPRPPARQWVLSVQERLRYTLRSDPAIQSLALQTFLSAAEQGLHSVCPGGPDAQSGAVAFIHRFGTLFDVQVHFSSGITSLRGMSLH